MRRQWGYRDRAALFSVCIPVPITVGLFASVERKYFLAMQMYYRNPVRDSYGYVCYSEVGRTQDIIQAECKFLIKSKVAGGFAYADELRTIAWNPYKINVLVSVSVNGIDSDSGPDIAEGYISTIRHRNQRGKRLRNINRVSYRRYNAGKE